jgi:hypothetical protein
MKGLIVWYFVSDTHKVMTSLILVLFALVCPELTQYCLVTTFFFYLPVCWMFSLITLICSIKVEMHYAHAPADLVTSRWNNSRNSSSANMSHWGWTLRISLYGRPSLWFSWIINERQKSVYFIFTDHMNNFRIYTTAFLRRCKAIQS